MAIIMDLNIMLSIFLWETHDTIRKGNVAINFMKCKEVKVLHTALRARIEADLVFVSETIQFSSVAKSCVDVIV